MAEPPQEPPPRQAPPGATEPYGSIIERFRGTQWESSPEAPLPPPNPLSRIFVVVGVVVLLVVGTIVIVVLPPQAPVATATPSRLIATPPPTPGPGDLLEAAFWTYVQTPALSYHETIEVVATIDRYRVTQKLSLDVYADDFSGTADLQAKGITQPLHLVLLRSGGVLYSKARGEAQWSDATAAVQLGIRPRPFLGLEDPRQLVYGGTTELSGTRLHRLVSTELYRPALTRVLPLAYLTLPTSQISLELLVTDGGVPVEARFTLHVPADPANAMPAVDGTGTYAFSEQGQVGPVPTPNL